MANLRAVPDTNVIVAGHHPGGRMGPNREFLVRWSRGEFALLYSFDTLKEALTRASVGPPRFCPILDRQLVVYQFEIQFALKPQMNDDGRRSETCLCR